MLEPWKLVASMPEARRAPPGSAALLSSVPPGKEASRVVSRHAQKPDQRCFYELALSANVRYRVAPRLSNHGLYHRTISEASLIRRAPICARTT
jgi:hypothetical protein